MEVKKAIKKRYGTDYIVGSIAETICKSIYNRKSELYLHNSNELATSFRIYTIFRSRVWQFNRLGVRYSKCFTRVFI